MKTVGVSPKVVAAVAAAIVSYLLTQSVLELPAVAVLLLNAVSVAVAAAAAGPGPVVPVADDVNSDVAFDGERGQGDLGHIVYICLAVLLVLVVVYAIVKLVDRV